MEEGRKIGVEEYKRQLAIKLLKDNMDIEEIKKFTELSKEEILELKNNI